VGSRLPLGGQNVTTLVFRTGRPARIDYTDASGQIGNVAAHDWGLRSSVGVPISVEGRLWGVIFALSTGEEFLPADTETGLAGFTELVATAIANAQARTELRGFAEEQAALRRVATLVARAAPPEEVFAAVAAEVGQLPGCRTSSSPSHCRTRRCRRSGRARWSRRAGGRCSPPMGCARSRPGTPRTRGSTAATRRTAMGPITGTVWAWLIGPYVDAGLRVGGDAAAARRLLEPFGDQLATAGLGTVSEIFDGDDPTGAKGCIAQAWSVAEVLRAWDRLERLAVPAGGEGAK
jgi:hypothetical protein